MTEDILLALDWIMEHGDFECDCDPVYESDTNATTHEDECAVWMEDHINTLIDRLRTQARTR